MRGQLLRTLFSLMSTLLLVGSLLTAVIWYVFNDNNVELQRPAPQKKITPQPVELCKDCSDVDPPKPAPPKKIAPPPVLCKGCKEIINKVLERYSPAWKRQEENYQKFRSELNSKCHGFEKGIITQYNTPVGTKLGYDGDKKKTLQVTPEIFSTFIKEHPFSNKTWGSCAVVGNGGILSNSSCGRMIDSSQFVMRCNLPPLQNGYEKHVGVKTDLVTANPSILFDKYGGLNGRRRPFVESLRPYGSSLLLLPAFSYVHNTPVSMRVFYTVEDFESPSRPIFFNPEYLGSLAAFWRAKGLKAQRPSTGIMMTSLALEVCSDVHLYGFWPFMNHPHSLQNLTNHYYDNRQTKSKFHAMPVEFDLLLQLHTQGVLKLHLGDCEAGGT